MHGPRKSAIRSALSGTELPTQTAYCTYGMVSRSGFMGLCSIVVNLSALSYLCRRAASHVDSSPAGRGTTGGHPASAHTGAEEAEHCVPIVHGCTLSAFSRLWAVLQRLFWLPRLFSRHAEYLPAGLSENGQNWFCIPQMSDARNFVPSPPIAAMRVRSIVTSSQLTRYCACCST